MIKDVRSLLQAASYNAKYGFNRYETETYEEVTAPLRHLLVKDAAYKMMNSQTYLAPHDPKRKTHLVTNALPCGIATSLYQEDDQGKWVPVDHS